MFALKRYDPPQSLSTNICCQSEKSQRVWINPARPVKDNMMKYFLIVQNPQHYKIKTGVSREQLENKLKGRYGFCTNFPTISVGVLTKRYLNFRLGVMQRFVFGMWTNSLSMVWWRQMNMVSSWTHLVKLLTRKNWTLRIRSFCQFSCR